MRGPLYCGSGKFMSANRRTRVWSFVAMRYPALPTAKGLVLGASAQCRSSTEAGSDGALPLSTRSSSHPHERSALVRVTGWAPRGHSPRPSQAGGMRFVTSSRPRCRERRQHMETRDASLSAPALADDQPGAGALELGAAEAATER